MSRMPQHELEARIDAVDARLVKDTCYKYIYDRQDLPSLLKRQCYEMDIISRSKHFNQYCVCADGFSRSFKSFSLTNQLLTFYLLLRNCSLILKMLPEILLRITFYVISQCFQCRPLFGSRVNLQELTCHRRVPVWFYRITGGSLKAFSVSKNCRFGVFEPGYWKDVQN